MALTTPRRIGLVVLALMALKYTGGHLAMLVLILGACWFTIRRDGYGRISASIT